MAEDKSEWQGRIEERLKNLENGKFITKSEFEPVRVVAYGIAGTFFVAGVVALLRLLGFS